MKIVLSTKKILVIDNFLPHELHSTLWDELQELDYVSSHSGTWYKHQPRDAGAVLEGPLYSIDGRVLTPQNSGIVAFLESIRQSESLFEVIIGKYGKTWEVFNARPTIIPAGSCISWHEDGGAKCGAFVYYAHPKWGGRWGGELLVAEGPVEAVLAEARRVQGNRSPYFESEILDMLLDEPAIGSYISPRPNRLVVLRGGTWHCVRRVEPAAGDNLRVSIAGFFLKKTKDQP